MTDLEGHRAVVTGAAGGIGRAVAQRLAEGGAAVALLDRDVAGLAEVEAGLRASGAAPSSHAVDLTSETEVQRAVTEAAGRHGGISILANCTGFLRSGPLDAFSEQDFDALMAVNVKSVWLATKHCLPHLRAAGARAAVINLSSVSAYVGTQTSWAYHTSKGAVSSFTIAIAQELAPDGIRVNAVAPGWVDAGFTHAALARHPDPDGLRRQAASAHLLGRMARPSEVAEAVAFLASDRAAFITGTILFVDGGFMVKR